MQGQPAATDVGERRAFSESLMGRMVDAACLNNPLSLQHLYKANSPVITGTVTADAQVESCSINYYNSAQKNIPVMDIRGVVVHTRNPRTH